MGICQLLILRYFPFIDVSHPGYFGVSKTLLFVNWLSFRVDK